MPKNLKLLPDKPGHDVITVRDAKGNAVSQHYTKRKGIIETVREMITDKPGSKNATGRGGRTRERVIDEAVEQASTGKKK